MNHLLQCHLGVQLDLYISELLVQLRLLKMTHVHYRRKMYCYLFFLCLLDDLFCCCLRKMYCFFSDSPLFCSDSGHLPRWQLFELLPLFIHGGFDIWNFQCMRHGDKLVHKIAMTQCIKPPFLPFALHDL